MLLKKLYLIILVILGLGIMFTSHLQAQALIKAELDATEYNLGELIEVNININQNPGIHGIYFDLVYDSSILEFDNIIKDELIKNESLENKLLYAVSEKDEAHIIVSYTLKGNGTLFNDIGRLLKIYFRVKNQGASGQNYSFTFNESGVYDGDENKLVVVTWQDSWNFTVASPYSGTFILIKEPYEHRVFYKDHAYINLICSVGDYKVQIDNMDNDDFARVTNDVTDGVLLNERVDLVYGFNIIKVNLCDSNNNLLGKDTVKVYRSDEDLYVRITDPSDHSLVNSDTVSVTVISPFDNIEVNGTIPEYSNDLFENGILNKEYRIGLKLQSGFNTITAIARDGIEPNVVVYKDSIEVYYHKDSSIFNFLVPQVGEHFKPSEDTNLYIKGEIGSRFKINNNPVDGGAVENIVTLEVVYKPNNRNYDPFTMVDNVQATITESSLDYVGARSKYIFYSDFDIPLVGLDNGELEISAYKNREGNTWDDKITRTVFVDNNRLWIDLKQPNVYTRDILDTYEKIRNFNETKDFLSVGCNMEISQDGVFLLESTERELHDEGLEDAVSLIEKENGTMYALVNDQLNGKMKIYKKHTSQTSWTLEGSWSDLFGYTLCDVDVGILVGVSSLFSTEYSEIYLLQNGQLLNIDFGDTILRDVKFIENHNGKIYLFGSYYDYLYSFNIYSLEQEGSKLKAQALNQTHFDNNDIIENFILTDNGNTAVLLTDSDDIYFYQKNGNSFQKIGLPSLNDDEGQVTGKEIVLGSYKNSDYNCYFVVKDDVNAEVIMQNKRLSRFYRCAVILKDFLRESDTEISFKSYGFNNDFFAFLYEKAGDYYVKRGRVFFGKLYSSMLDPEQYLYGALDLPNYKLFIADSGSLYTGIGAYDGQNQLYSLYKKYKSSGGITFNYVNDDIDGITGISFEIDPLILEYPDSIEFAFQAREKTGSESQPTDPVIFEQVLIALDELVDLIDGQQGDYFTIHKNYDAGENRDVIHFKFNELQEGRYIHIEINMQAIGNSSTTLHNLKIYKKIRAKIVSEPDQDITLPVHGYVYDRTVEDVTIAITSGISAKVNLERDGSFYHDLLVSSNDDEIPVEIYCTNKIGETVRIDFTIEIAESKNEILTASYKRVEDTGYVNLTPQNTEDFVISTINETISLSGTYYGLSGCVVGYELYDFNQNDKPELVVRGLFDVVLDSFVYSDFDNLGSGYEAGYFDAQDIVLIPGIQRLVIYCENPGGKRVEYIVDDMYPEIRYDMPLEDQQIEFDNLAVLNPAETLESVPIDFELARLSSFEGETEPYVFTGTYEVTGRVKSLYTLADVRVESFTEELTFENGLTEATIPLEAGNRFYIKITVELKGDEFQKDFYVGVFPTKSFLADLKRGFKVTAKKSFEDTNFIPDFSAMHPDNWTAEQEESLQIPFKFSFNREDVPLKTTTDNKGYIEANLVVNYDFASTITGEVYKDDDYYYLMDTNGDQLKLTSSMLKEDNNRIEWALIFRDFVDEDINGAPYRMSYSASGKQGMEDYIFYYESTTVIADTEIFFSEDLTGQYYYSVSLPQININKDLSTVIQVHLNNTLIWDDDGETTGISDFSLVTDGLGEGKNTLIVCYTELDKPEVTKEYIFLYDSEDPVVKIESFKVNEDFTKLLELKASVVETNFAEGFLYHGVSIINQVPKIIIKDESRYELVWTFTEADNIEPSVVMPVKITVEDLAGKSTESSPLTGFEDLVRPAKDPITEVNMDMSNYNGEPVLDNESNYDMRDFPGHTKIAPDKIIKRESIKESVEDNDNYLIRSVAEEKKDPVYWSKCESVSELITPEIGSGELRNSNDSYLGPTTNTSYAKYGYALYRLAANQEDFHRNYYALDSASEQGTVSVWFYSTTAWYSLMYFYFGTNDHVTIGNLSKRGLSPILTVAGNQEDSYSNVTGLNHWYIIWDKAKNLEGGESVQVFLNGSKVMSTTADLDSTGSDDVYFGYRVQWGAVAFDNIKIWDYIPAENPDWILNAEDPENVLTPEDFLKPDYWSRCEFADNLVDADIVSEMPFITNPDSLYTDLDGQYDNCINARLNPGSTVNFYPFGENFICPDKVTLSFYLRVDSGPGIHTGVYFNKDNVSAVGLTYVGGHWNHMIRINNSSNYAATDNTPLQDQWNHVYIVYDKTASLDRDNNKTLRIFIDNVEVMSTNEPIEPGIFSMYFSNSSSATLQSWIRLDNLKIWKKIVSEDPSWLNELEGNEDKLKPTEEDYKPDYYSKCESVNNLSDAEIKETEPVITNLSYLHTDSDGYFNNCVRGSFPVATDSHIFPFGENFDAYDKLTVSFYLKLQQGLGIGSHCIVWFNRINDTRINFGHPRDGADLNTLILNNSQEGYDNTAFNVWKHVYIVLNKAGSLEDQKTVRVFVDAAEILHTNTLIDINDFSIWLSSDGAPGPQSNVYIDNIKIWKDVISEDPNWLSGCAGVIIDNDYGKYLVFKITKDPFINNITTKEDIEDNINFHVIGKYLDEENNTQLEYSPLSPLAFSDNTKYQYIEGTNYLYYMVDTEELNTLYQDASNELFGEGKPLDPNGELVIIDPGSLLIEYSDQWTNFKSADIYITGKNDSEDGQTIYNTFKDIIVYYPGYEDPAYDPGLYNHINIHPNLRLQMEDRSFTKGADSEEMTLNFWLRLEDEGIFESVYENTIKRILTFEDTGGEIINLSFNGRKFNFTDHELVTTELCNLNTGKDAWNMVSLTINKADNTVGVYVNSVFIQGFVLSEEVIDQLLHQDVGFFFSAPGGEEYNTGFYSVALPFFINRLYTQDEIERVYNLYDNAVRGDVEYHFTGQNDVFGDGNADLHQLGGDDFFTVDQNVNYTEDLTNGSFKASDRKQNLLKIHEFDNKYCVILQDAEAPITSNLDIEGDTNSFRLIPDAGKTGTYYFGDINGNYGLTKDDYYSVSGYVESIDADADARIILRINGGEQGIDLEQGPFHFVFNNTGGLTPSDVKLYVKTIKEIELSANMSLNAGNFIVAHDMDKTAGSTTFPFDLAGTVHFFFKPLNAGKNGYVNYDGVLFDSEYIKIGTIIRADGDAVYYAFIKDEDGNTTIPLVTNTKVSYKWQHIQLSYSCEQNIVYLYIDGRIAAQSESALLPVFGSLQGNVPGEDNTYIGTDMDEVYYANGYFDDVVISRYYLESVYDELTPEAIQPVNIEYDTDSSTINKVCQGIIQLSDVTGVSYRLEALDKDMFLYSTTFPVDVSTIPAGRYRLTTSMNVNGHAYKDILTFNINNRPDFTLVETTPLIFACDVDDVKSNLDLKFRYDNSYQFKGTDLVYAGVTVKINYNSTDTINRYLVQDFQTQDTSAWLVGTEIIPGTVDWQSLSVDNTGLFNINFLELESNTEIDYDFISFYFEDDFANLTALTFTGENSGTIPIATIIPGIDTYQVTEKDENGDDIVVDYEYRLTISVLDEQSTSISDSARDIFSNIDINHIVRDSEGFIADSGSNNPDYDGIIELYYDDILPDYGAYTCELFLEYNNVEYASVGNIYLNWEQRQGEPDNIVTPTSLEILDFSLLYLDADNDTASMYLKYDANSIGNIDTVLQVIKDGSQFGELLDDVSLFGGEMDKTYIYEDISIPKGKFSVKIVLKAEGLICSKQIEITNDVLAPTLVLTNWVESYTPYDNVLFSWKGFHNGSFNEDIEYSYNVDGRGWSTQNNQWRSVRLYNLEEGWHEFEVKAIYNGKESITQSQTFFVDVKRPQINEDAISIEKLYDKDGVFYKINIIGASGAITDASQKRLYVNSERIGFEEDGSFEANNILLTKDGINKILITATDKVNNFTDYYVTIDNSITEIIFPDTERHVKYCPLVIVGRINDDIEAGLEIYIKDTMSTDAGGGDYSGWKKAKINADRTFFVENIYINPGTDNYAILTPLTIKSVFESGVEFERELNIKANLITLPIVITLDTHAAEGENTNTWINIDCTANVENISSWSIDYDGDGVYDDIQLTENPHAPEAMVYSWSHKYSSLGLVEPRVRVITTDGNFFSVTDTLIIHEKIKEASNKIVNNPLSLSAISMPDSSKRIYVLHEDDSDIKNIQYIIKVYEVGRNENYISGTLDPINLTRLSIENPVIVRALDKDHLFIGTNGPEGKIYEITANAFGNYYIEESYSALAQLNDITIDDYNLFISFENQDNFIKVPITALVMDKNSAEKFIPQIHHSVPISANTGLAKDQMGLLVADYYNQRIVRLTNSLNMNDIFGSLGVGEGQFLKPTLVKVFENRIFVFDEARGDIQVFDLNFTPVCTLEYSLDPEYHNYLEPEFFNDIADIDIIAREEGNLLYYYALILSKSTGELAMLRLPQWEELRARVRNNKIVFIDDGEIFTAKPDGGDLSKILSSDSIPRIEGTLDYPALSPDGKSLVFTSRSRLYHGEQDANEAENNIYAYDNVYVVDIETRDLRILDLGDINGYEIERPVFNSNGDKLIFSAKEEAGKWQIYVFDFESGAVSKLFDSDENARLPYYSPDDRFVVFTTDYDGDEEIEIIDTGNTAIRVSVTKNSVRDSLPVWNTVYPFEINDPQDEYKIESKIAFVSERDFHKSVYYVYLSRPSESDIRVVIKKTGGDVGNDPDQAAIEVPGIEEGDYPCFTGDGTKLIFEYFDGETEKLRVFNFEEEIEEQSITDMQLPGSAVSPAGMKNMITNFKAVNKNGDEIELTWDRYTESDIFYMVWFKENKPNTEVAPKKVFNQGGTTLKGLEMGQEYLVKVCIIENDIEVATSQWKKVKMPEVVARPTVEIDEGNPYLTHLHAWKPDEDKIWYFSWIIDNNEINVGTGQDYNYEFATSGTKTIMLKASNQGSTVTNYSVPVEIKIISDIKPVIEYVLAEDSSYIELSAENSLGDKIDLTSALWIISGPGRDPVQVTGSNVIAQLNGFEHKINVNLILKRIPVNGQSSTDTLEKNMVIDLEFKAVRPFITCSVSEQNKRLFHFSGELSRGNIDWHRAKWALYANNGVLYTIDGVSNFEYFFPETNEDTIYSVSLNVPRRNDGSTETVSKIISVESAPIEAVINYEVLTIKEGQNTIGTKILFDCTQSTGSDIDFNQARWSVPVAGAYGEQPTQFGPTALFSLVGIEEDIVVEVALTLNRRGGTDPITITKLINLKSGELPDSRLIVTTDLIESADGTTLVLDVLKSTGPNIDWEKTEWQIDGQPYPKNGPITRIDVPASGEDRIINYVCTLYRFGGKPQTVTADVELNKTIIEPFVTYRRLSEAQSNVYELSVLNTSGINIEWEKTRWLIFDGNENIVERRGAKISHAFALKSDAMGYPVLVEMYLKGSSLPFIGYATVDVDGDELRPIITYDREGSEPNVLTFNATVSRGSNIDWQSVKWTFGDSSESQYGAVVTHEYPINSENMTYRVTLTLTRKSINGSTEVKTVHKDIRIYKDEINVVLNAKLEADGFLVLSAEDSEGRGLLLDRSVWLFPGKGDSESQSDYNKDGKIIVDRHEVNAYAGIELGINKGAQTGGDSGFFVSFSAGGGYKYTYETTDYSEYEESNASFTLANTHTGPICRRYVEDDIGSIIVSLFVYRMTTDGGVEGKSALFNINLQDARSGVVYK